MTVLGTKEKPAVERKIACVHMHMCPVLVENLTMLHVDVECVMENKNTLLILVISVL